MRRQPTITWHSAKQTTILILFKGIYSLPSAHYAEIIIDLDVGKLSVVPKRYWEMNGSRKNSDSEDELSNQLLFKILDSVEKHMRRA